MKTIITALILIVVSLSARAEFVSADIGLNGLTCSMCSRGTEASLRQLPFVDKISIDLNTLVAHITFKHDKKVSIDAIRSMVEEAGFSVRSVDATFNFDHVQVGKDVHFAFGGDTYHFVGVGERTLTGPVTLRFIDKPYVSKKEFGEFASKTSLACYKNAGASSCCTGDHSVVGKLYHVTL